MREAGFFVAGGDLPRRAPSVLITGEVEDVNRTAGVGLRDGFCSSTRTARRALVRKGLRS
jgi:hypothetical protein